MEKLYTGALRDPEDKRDRVYDIVAAAAPIEIDWEKGFDIRNELGGDIYFKNQFTSSSCVGQGSSYYFFVLQVVEMMEKYGMTLDELRKGHADEVDEISARAIYSQIFLSGGGAYIRDAFKLVCDWGAVFERYVKSYQDDGSVTEAFMRDKTWFSAAMTELAKTLKGKEYRVIKASSNMDLFAQAILENKGVVGGVEGDNNGTWRSERPQPPDKDIGDSADWAHCLYFGAFGKDEFGKFIAMPNSWGNLLGKTWYHGAPPGYGWQKLYQNYFDNGGRWMFNPWTYTDLKNNNTIMKLVKSANENTVYLENDLGDLFPIAYEKFALDVFSKGNGWSDIEVEVKTIDKTKIKYPIGGYVA